MAKVFAKQVEDKDFLATLEKTPEYKRMQPLIEKALLEQWNDVLYSGVINTIFNKYKDFIVKRGKKLDIKKTITKATNEEELDEAIAGGLQHDKFLVGEKDMKMKLYLLFLTGLVLSNIKSIGSYYDFRKSMNAFLKTMSNKGGQNIINLIDTPKAIKFRLSNVALKSKITQRVNTLIKGLDAVTKKNLVRHLALGIKNHETKTQILKRMQKTGKQFAKNRAKRIIQTETEAVAEFMRYETASMNGVESRTWETVGDDRVCILGYSTKIKTILGWKGIGSIKPDDYVLTHKDRYRKVLATSRTPYNKEIITVSFGVTGLGGNMLSLTTTSEHPYLTKRGWIEAKELKEKDEIYMLAKKCDLEGCNNECLFSRKFCSSKCLAISNNKKIWEDPKQHKRVIRENKKYDKGKKLKIIGTKVIEKNKEQWKKNISDTQIHNFAFNNKYKKVITESNRRRAKAPDFGFRNLTKEQKFENTRKARISLGKNHLGQSGLERKIGWALDKLSIKYIPQYEIKTKQGYRWADFYLPKYNLIIEADGKYWHDKKKDDIRDKLIKEVRPTIFILHIPEDTIRNNLGSCFDIIKSNIGMGCFTTLKIKNIKKKQLKKAQAVYNLQVAEDESYVAKGVVVHNCPVCAPLDGVTRKMNKPFMSGDFEGKYPPAHVICRCSVTYDISSNLAVNFVSKARTTFDRIDEMFTKAYVFYTPLKEKGMSVVNPNAVWAGGSVLIGPDRGITGYIKDLQQQYDYRKILRGLLKTKENMLLVDIARKDEDMFIDSVSRLVINAREGLTDEGFVQFIRYFGFSTKIPPKI